MTTDTVKLIECPRDAWQGLKQLIPAPLKAGYLRSLIDAGFRHIDAVSFVSPKAVPQMADAEQVLLELNPSGDVEIIGIVVNERGAQRAIATRAVRTLGFPYSVSPTFLRKNQNQTAEAALNDLRKIKRAADQADLGIVVYISMAFGNPYGDPWSADTVVDAAGLLESEGIRAVSLADTVGLASPDRIRDLVSTVVRRHARLEVGVHLHSRPEQTGDKVLAAYDAGCRRFDSALGGLGGCPFAQDEMVGNIATERLLEALTSRGVVLPVGKLPGRLLAGAAEIAAKYRSARPPATQSGP